MSPPEGVPLPLLPLDAGIAAVRLARAEAEAEVRRERSRSRAATPSLEPVRGAFVTLWQGPQLRGCIGYPEPDEPLHAVLPLAARGAVRDPRFDPVRPRELALLRVEVSVLTPPRPLEAEAPERLPDLVRIGEHGLVVQRGRMRGLLLPQVALDHGLDAAGFLGACCAKAGLSPEAWRSRDGLRWSTFTAQVFEEEVPSGPVVERRDERPELA